MIRGEIWWADFGVPFGSEPGFKRPVVVVQNDDFNKSNISTVIIVPLTTNLDLENAPGNVFMERGDSGLSKDSIAVVSQLYAIDKKRLEGRIGELHDFTIKKIEEGILLVLGFRH